ncbi:MAG: amino acid ABC transporter permease [Hyphomicrobiaceae bacterium]
MTANRAQVSPAPVMLAPRATASPSLGAAAWLIVPNGPLRAAIDGRALAIIALFCLVATAASAATTAANGERSALEVIWLWAPLLLKGFVFNLVISALAMMVGTIAGLPLGVLQSSAIAPVRWLARFVTQFFRNSPWLVLLFLCVLLLPFQIRIFGLTIPMPDWSKAILGFSLPVMANVSEIVRGALQSVPTSQWESAESLGFSRTQTLMRIILPQCFKRMLPPWMNLYSLITMSTVNASVVGVSEMITLTGEVLAAEGSRPALLAPLYAFAMLCFFLYCYPIGKWTVALERKFQVKH